MNRKNLPVLIGFSLLVAANVFAGDNEKGIEYYRAELYGAAKIFFLQQKNQSVSEQAENYYYLGQTYYQLNQDDSASYYYKKAIDVFLEYPFGYVGEGMLQLKKGNTKAAEELFKKANNLAKKNPSVQTTIAEVYVEMDDYNNANLALEKARKINNKYSGIYLVEGDMLMKQGKVGPACTRYENAILFNSSDKVAYLKIAQVYTGINTTIALQYLDKLIALDPNYIPAYALIGDINREAAMYNKALDAYEKFIAIPGVPLEQHERYAQLLFFTEQYSKALDHIKYVISKDPNNLVMKRLEAYNSLRLENYPLGLEQINQFLKEMPEERHIYLDYFSQGQLAFNLENPELAMNAFQKAIELDSARATADKLYKEMANIAFNAGLYEKAIDYFEKYFAIDASTTDTGDYFLYGRANYYLAADYIVPENISSVTTPDALEEYEAAFKNFVQKGDQAFTEVIKRRPNMHIGYIWRANINAFLDNYDQNKTGKMAGYAKPFFDDALEFMLENNSDGARNKDIVSAYLYMANYYFSINNIPAVIDYYKKVLQIDPSDEQAKKNLKLLNVKY